MNAHALVNGGPTYAIWAELTRCNRDSIGSGGRNWRNCRKSNSELPQLETGMADTPVKQVTRKPLSMEINYRQELSLDIVDIG